MAIGRTNACVQGVKLQIGDITQEAKYENDQNFLKCDGQTVFGTKAESVLPIGLNIDISSMSYTKILSSIPIPTPTRVGEYVFFNDSSGIKATKDGVNFLTSIYKPSEYLQGNYYVVAEEPLTSGAYYVFKSQDLLTWTTITGKVVGVSSYRSISLSVIGTTIVVWANRYSSQSDTYYITESYSTDIGTNWIYSKAITESNKETSLYKINSSKAYYIDSKGFIITTVDGINFINTNKKLPNDTDKNIHVINNNYYAFPYKTDSNFSFFTDIRSFSTINNNKTLYSFNRWLFDVEDENGIYVCGNAYNTATANATNEAKYISYSTPTTKTSIPIIINIFKLNSGDYFIFFQNDIDYFYTITNSLPVKIPIVTGGYIKIK